MVTYKAVPQQMAQYPSIMVTGTVKQIETLQDIKFFLICFLHAKLIKRQ